MTKHIEVSLPEMEIIQAQVDSLVKRKGWVFDAATNRDLVGVALHVLNEHTGENFDDQMYRHIAAIGREELSKMVAPGVTVETKVFGHVYDFIKNAIGK